jgi:hypothetical protein
VLRLDPRLQRARSSPVCDFFSGRQGAAAPLFCGKPSLSPNNGIDNWVGALWDVRKACGKEFTDSALLYALKAFDDEGGRNPE